MFDHWFKFSRNKSPAPPDATSPVGADQTPSTEMPETPKMGADFRPLSNASTNPLSLPEQTSRFLLRQPVLDAGHNTVGYDFGFQHAGSGKECPFSPSEMQIAEETLLTTISQLDIRSLSGHRRTFVAIGPALLDSSWVSLLPVDQMVLVIDGTRMEGAPTVLAEQCRARIGQGYTLAFDNLPDVAGVQELVGLAAYLRFDLHAFDALELERRLASLHGHKELALVARQVSNEDDYQAARVMGFDLFQGYYFQNMNPALPHRVDNDRLRVMELLNMTAQHAEFVQIEKAIKHDVLLAYKLLIYINCPLNGLTRKIESIAQALMFLGYEPLYRWLTLLLFADGEQDPRDRALLQNALVRARLTESLGKNLLSAEDADSLFIVGIFSLLDVLFNVPMAQALENLNLSEAVKRALIQQHGPYAPFLRLAIAFENADQQQVNELTGVLALDAHLVNQLHIDAVNWATALNI